MRKQTTLIRSPAEQENDQKHDVAERWLIQIDLALNGAFPLLEVAHISESARHSVHAIVISFLIEVYCI